MTARPPRETAALVFVLSCLPTACSKRSAEPRDRSEPTVATTTASVPSVEKDLVIEREIGDRADALSATLYRYDRKVSRGEIWVARVRPKAARIDLLPSSEPAPLAKVLAGHEPPGDYVAINGGFYDAAKPMGLVIVDGKTLAPATKRGGSGMFLVDERGPAIVHRDEREAFSPHPRIAIQSIDRLVDRGKVLVKEHGDARRDARSAVAIEEDGSVLFVAMFDREAGEHSASGTVQLNGQASSIGLTLGEAAELLARDRAHGGFGARFALNLDGGFSTSMRVHLKGATLELVAHRATINALMAH